MRLEVGAGRAGDAPAQLLDRRLVVAQAEIRLRQEVQHDARIVRVEPHGDRDRLQRLGRLPGIHQRQPGRRMALGEVGIELDHAATFRQRAVVIAPP